MVHRCLMPAILAVLVLAFQSADAAQSATIYLIPFEIETYEPVTRASIVCDAHEVWEVSDLKQAQTLIEFLRNGDATHFDEKRIRVKVLASNLAFYIDAQGAALENDLVRRIDREQFVRRLISLGGKRIDRPSC